MSIGIHAHTCVCVCVCVCVCACVDMCMWACVLEHRRELLGARPLLLLVLAPLLGCAEVASEQRVVEGELEAHTHGAPDQQRTDGRCMHCVRGLFHTLRQAFSNMARSYDLSEMRR